MASTRKCISDCMNEFTLAMYKQIAAEKPAEDMFLSPSNVAVVMIMVYIGARKQTEEQMVKALKLVDLDKQDVLKEMQRFNEKLQDGSKYVTINTANSLFPHSDKRVLEDYLSIIKKYFRSKVRPMDFTSKADKSRLDINSWVEQNTNNKIKNIIPVGVLTPLTAMVVVNTIYFKGNWEIPFESKYTETEEFTKLNGDKVNIRMMKAKRMEDVYFSKSRAHDCKVLKLSYEDRKIGMVIILPNENDGLPALESALDLKTLRELIDSLKEVTVDVSLPKFKLESSVQLKHVLSNLGMVDVFDEEEADLTGMGKELYVSEVYHKTFINVNEEGTEAGAATAAVARSRCLEETYRFRANHPFLFMIWHYRLDVPLFIGRLVEPIAVQETLSHHKRHRSHANDEYHSKRRR